MKVKAIMDEDFSDYKKASMFIGTLYCGGKCCIEAGIPISVCQNDSWREKPALDLPDDKIIERYLSNPLTEAIVFGGLEPFEQYPELLKFIKLLREKYKCNDDVVIYTGFYKDELDIEIKELIMYPNIVFKFGRYVPNSTKRFDEVLGVELASQNQYGERIS